MKEKNAASTLSLRGKKKPEGSLSRPLESGSHNKIIT